MTVETVLLGTAFVLAVLGWLLISRGLVRIAATHEEFHPVQRKNELHSAVAASLVGGGMQLLALALGVTGVLSLHTNNQHLQAEVAHLSTQLVSRVQQDIALADAKIQPAVAAVAAAAPVTPVAAADEVQIETPSGKGVLLRETPAGAVIGELAAGTQLTRLEQMTMDDQAWVRVRNANTNGWVAQRYVKTAQQIVAAGNGA